MKRELKHRLAYAVMVAAADMLDDWPATICRHPELSEIDPDEAANVVAHWLDRLPGRDWDDRLPEDHWD